MSVFSARPATSIVPSITLKILTALPSTECNGVRPGVEGEFHRHAENDMTAASAGLIDPDRRAAVHAGQTRKRKAISSTAAWKVEGHNKRGTHLTVVFLQAESPFAK